MRWNCPHCSNLLALPDEKLDSGWQFTRCIHCGGFAVIRKPEINLVKVDEAPPGEQVLLPEASEVPLLNHTAARNMRQHYQQLQQESENYLMNVNVPGVKAPKVRPARRSERHPFFDRVEVKGASATERAAKLPNPLPQLSSIRSVMPISFLPIAIGIAGIIAIGSGIYLYVQGQSLWKKARQTTTQTKARTEIIRPEIEKVITQTETTDQISRPAYAPKTVRTTEVTQTEPPATSIKEKPKPLRQPMAHQPLQVQIKNVSANLRAGPGLHYPIVGKAHQLSKYLVADWEDRWFRIIVSKEKDGTQRAAWIRNDLVKLSKLPHLSE